ncbi:helix-turn-helix domain-containing protein [Streptomyces violaceusniger]|uniref:helix-turn-helix domain-containing protein n=1 Tax=Streptomyces violaceusniger TaxID=68280 RepID=UPI003002BAAF
MYVDKRTGAAQRIKDGAIPEQVAAELGVSRSTLYREMRKHREDMSAKPVIREI